MELKAYQAYKNPDMPITFWRTSSGYEVDFILGDKDIALEIKGSSRIHDGDTLALKALQEDGPIKHSIIVCLENEPRQLSNKIQIFPWELFLKKLWNNDFFIGD